MGSGSRHAGLANDGGLILPEIMSLMYRRCLRLSGNIDKRQYG